MSGSASIWSSKGRDSQFTQCAKTSDTQQTTSWTGCATKIPFRYTVDSSANSSDPRSGFPQIRVLPLSTRHRQAGSVSVRTTPGKTIQKERIERAQRKRACRKEKETQMEQAGQESMPPEVVSGLYADWWRLIVPAPAIVL